MLKELNYVCFDFEMTGMNENDEPIQIGILQFDKNFNIINQYKSYIKPRKKIQELKSVVSYITGLKVQDIENAPYFEDIIHEILPFFNENTILVGQSIQIDIDILKQYMDLKYLAQIDTFTLSKTVIHFLPSYALEVINEIIKDKRTTINTDIGENYHDALYDSFITYNTFKYCIEYIEKLIQEYPILSHYIKNSNNVLNSILDLSSYKINVSKDKFFLPTLKKNIRSDAKIYNKDSYNLDGFTNYTKIYTGNIPVQKLISNLVTNKEKIILAFVNQSKVDIIKSVIEQLGIRNTGTLYENVVFDENNIKLLLSKETFEDFEVNFLIKYFSQYNLGHSILDINSNYDIKVFNFLTQAKTTQYPNIILTTHNKLFEHISENKNLVDYKIIFFDWDFWYNSFSKFSNKPFDIYEYITNIENIIYKLEFTQDISKINNYYQSLMIFTGVLFSEITSKFKNIQENKIELNPIIGNIDFHKTNNLLENLDSLFNQLKDNIPQSDFNYIQYFQNKLYEILSHIISVEKKMYNESKFFFVFHPTTNVLNYQEFIYSFQERNVIFITNFDKEKSIKIDKDSFIENSTKIQRVENKLSLIDHLKENESSFVLCVSKNHSKDLFDELFNKKYHEEYKILVENITGGWGKNIFYAQRSPKKIVIGGYDFYLGQIAKGVRFDNIYIYFICGPIEKQIINDLYYWNT